MPFATWNVGTAPNDETGDTLRDAFIKVRESFARTSLAPFGTATGDPAANQIPYYNSPASIAYTALSAYGRTMIGWANTAAAQAALGIDPTGTPASLGLKDLNDADLSGRRVSVNGTALQGAGLNWPAIAGHADASSHWWNVVTFGAMTRRTQFAIFGFGSDRGRTFVRALHDAAWSAWSELLRQGANVTLGQSNTMFGDYADLRWRTNAGGKAWRITSTAAGTADGDLVTQFSSDAFVSNFVDVSRAKPDGSVHGMTLAGARFVDPGEVATAPRTGEVSYQFTSLSNNALAAASAMVGSLTAGRGHGASVMSHASGYSTDRYGGAFVGARTMGAGAAHGAVTGGKALARLVGVGSDGASTYRLGGEIVIEAAETFSPTASGGRIRFLATAAGSLTAAEVMRIGPAGAVMAFNGSDSFTFNGAANGVNGIQFNDAAAGQRVRINATGADADTPIELNARGAGSAFIGNTGGGAGLEVYSPPSRVNYLRVAGAAAGGTIELQALGADANIPLVLGARGTGSLFLRSNGINALTIDSDAGATGLAYIRALAGNVVIGAHGVPANVDMSIQAKGAGRVYIGGAGGWGLEVEATASTVNRIRALGAAAGGAPSLRAEGADTNIPLLLRAKGTGGIDVGNARITSVGTPTGSSDAAPKSYVDAAVSVCMTDRQGPVVQVAPPNATTVVQFGNAGSNAHAALPWNASTNRVTPTVPGAYLVTCTVLASAATAAGDMTFMLTLNGVTEFARWYWLPTNTNFYGHTISGVIVVNGTTDFIDARIAVAAATGNVNLWTGRRFTINRIGVS